MTLPTPPRSSLFVRFLSGFLALSAGPALAQADPPATPPPVEFDMEPVVIESMGMHVYMPAGASIQTRFVAGGQSKTLVQPADATWMLNVYETISSNTELTTSDVLDVIIHQRGEPLKIEDPFRTSPNQDAFRNPFDVVDRDDGLTIGDRAASRAYLRHPRDPNFPVSGYLVLRVDAGQFVVFQFDTLPVEFDKRRHVFETLTATARFPDHAEAKAERREAIVEGQSFLAAISPEELESVLSDEPTYMRVYRPSLGGATGDAQEIGFQKIVARRGQVGELDPAKPRVRWTADEREFGFLVQLEARVLISDYVVDTRAIYFLATDRSSEMWSILIEEKGRDEMGRVRVNKTTQTVARNGKEMHIHTTRPGSSPEEKRFEVLEDTYASAVERYLIPKIVAARGASDPGARFDLAYYNFDPQRSVVTLRRESFDRTADGGWHCTTIPSEGQPEWTTTYDASGELVQRSVEPGPTVFETTTREKLQRLWKKKDLPID